MICGGTGDGVLRRKLGFSIFVNAVDALHAKVRQEMKLLKSQHENTRYFDLLEEAAMNGWLARLLLL